MAVYSENEIIEKIKSGDLEAFSVLVEKYKKKAISIAYSFCANYEDAKDLSQEAFIKAFKSLKRFKIKSKFYTWFYRILVNLCKDYLRHRKRDKIVSLSIRLKSKDGQLEQEDIFAYIASDNPGPQKVLLNKELGAKLSSAINSLPPRQRIIFTLKNIHAMTIAEIAQVTRCAQGTVKAHLFKATANLQIKLEKYVRINIGGGEK
tara:strand:- start:43 stop:657 length:615 start_codon:yes stop_codon:yes gene_type:complete